MLHRSAVSARANRLNVESGKIDGDKEWLVQNRPVEPAIDSKKLKNQRMKTGDCQFHCKGSQLIPKRADYFHKF